MSDLLSFEEAIVLKELVEESQKEGESMRKLTVSSHQLTVSRVPSTSLLASLAYVL